MKVAIWLVAMSIAILAIVVKDNKVHIGDKLVSPVVVISKYDYDYYQYIQVIDGNGQVHILDECASLKYWNVSLLDTIK